MNSMGDSGDKKSYRVILLLIVGLAAFSSAMKELNQVREFTRETSNLVASWSNVVAPAPVPEGAIPAQVPQTAVKVKVCDSGHTLNAAGPVENVQLGGAVAQAQEKIKEVGKPFVAERSRRRDQQVATLRGLRSLDVEIMDLRQQVRRHADLKATIVADGDGEAEFAVPPDLELKLPKVKARQILIRPEERDVLLKSLNRSLNLRSAG